MELSGEYVGPDGEQQRLRVLCDGTGDADSLQNLLSGVTQMKELVSDFFGPLVQQEAQGRVSPDETLDGDGEDDAEDENNIDKRTNSDGPSAKRPKLPS
ncbi:EKC/KEOPS complex subunit GON7 isoform X1 [Ictidomys tridecemlineatus]|uniref:GON7 subunit of KEOPS complex n=1 Tax=Ictidomys tridecemlineatus TaxID=43179 RepID=A0A287D5A6_ICTTR|nr:EKC/KEOPS complex subunit GON7 [Ictidomys tridecemlineatus]KAG3260476.1 hypothetical protein H1C71_015432 [Ictidomys tridecemlineatus]